MTKATLFNPGGFSEEEYYSYRNQALESGSPREQKLVKDYQAATLIQTYSMGSALALLLVGLPMGLGVAHLLGSTSIAWSESIAFVTPGIGGLIAFAVATVKKRNLARELRLKIIQSENNQL